MKIYHVIGIAVFNFILAGGFIVGLLYLVKHLFF